MLFSASKKHKVVSTSTAQTVAKVTGFVVDVPNRQVVAVTVKGTKAGDVIEWPAITAFGVDAVTIDSENAITTATGTVRELAAKDHRIMGKLVLSAEGDVRGKVTDAEFDGTTGRISFIMVDRAPVAGDRLVGLGRYAVVVRTD
jgi:sporulation protein YlmC with PRC-barrel domain